MNIMTITDILRRLENIIRVGTISSVKGKYCQVKTGNITTDWIKWLAHRAGDDIEWWPPSVGEQVLLLSLSGELTTAFALTGIIADDTRLTTTSRTVKRLDFQDGASIEYDSVSHKLTVTNVKEIMVFNTDHITIQANTKITLNAPVIEILGNVTHSGDQLSSNGVVLDKHQHSGVSSGTGNSGKPI